MSLGLIWAQAESGVIGRDGGMPWRLPEDFAHFKELTLGTIVVMGRRTWDSLPPSSKPLQGRTNIVVTRSAEWNAAGASRVSSVTEALKVVGGRAAWVIGGAQIYAATIKYADQLEVTTVRGEFEGDTYAPEINDRWRLVHTDPVTGWHESRTGLQYRFAHYTTDKAVARSAS
jgi:dihydrofolate reductase